MVRGAYLSILIGILMIALAEQWHTCILYATTFVGGAFYDYH
jgi:hypothetical protein